MTTSEESVAQIEADAFERAAKVAYRICAEARHATLGDKIESAIRAEARVPASGGAGDGPWRTMEDAPRDGTWFLAYWRPGRSGINHHGVIAWRENEDGVLGWMQDREPVGDPDRWMPLPALAASPPAAMDEGAKNG